MPVFPISNVLLLMNASADPRSSGGSFYISILAALVTLGLLGALGVLSLLRTQRRGLKAHYEDKVKSIESRARGMEDQCRSDRQATGTWHAQARQQRSENLQLLKERESWRKVHPKYRRLAFNIGVIGWRGTGKTALCLRMTDPLFRDLNATVSSALGVEYDLSVITVTNQHTSERIEHVFRFIEWGGEYIIPAQADLLRRCDPSKAVDSDQVVDRVGIQALVLVVDLAAPMGDGSPADVTRPGPQVLNHKRIREQIEKHLDQRSLEFIINPTLMTYLQTVVVFINKADILPGSPAEQEATARHEYHDLLVNVGRVYPNFTVIVGSVSTDAGLLKMYSHLVEKILPDDVKKQRPFGRALDPDVMRPDAAGGVRASAGDPPPSLHPVESAPRPVRGESSGQPAAAGGFALPPPRPATMRITDVNGLLVQ